MKKYTLLFFVLYLCISCPNILQAQTQKLYSTDNGLSNSLINKIFQDSAGFIWVATEYGLNRYDSNKFMVYCRIEEDSTSLKNNYVHTIFEDSDNNLYVGTITGMHKFRRDRNSFEEIKMYSAGSQIYPHVTSLIEFKNGEIWIATSGQGIFSMKKGDRQAFLSEQLSSDIGVNYGLLIHKDRSENIWIGTENKGLIYYNIHTRESHIFDARQGISSDHVSAILESESGDIFVGTLTNGLNLYNKTTRSFDLIPYVGRDQLLIKSLMFTSSGQLMIGTDGQGLKIYDPRSNIVRDFSTEFHHFDLNNGKVHSILQDKDNNLWLGLFQKGVAFIPSIEKKFKYWGYKMYNGNPLGTGCIMSICKDREGVTWVGTDNEGVYGINNKGERIAHYHQTNNPTSVSNSILSIHEDLNGTLWLGSYTKGLARLNKKTGMCDYIPQLKNQKVYFISHDRKNNLLIGTYGGGFYMMDLKTEELTQYESTKEAENDLKIDRLSNNWINTMLTDGDGLIWIGHYKGVSCYDPIKNSFFSYYKQNNMLPGTVVVSLQEDHSGNIWIGSTDGLYLFDKVNYVMKKITTSDGLSNNVICGIEEDADNNIWISTYHGMNKYILAENRFENYYVGDGLQGNEFTRGASFRDKAENLFFGGTNGVTFFNPREINEEKKGVKLILTNFFLANQTIRAGDQSEGEDIISNSVSQGQIFNLSHKDNSFSFEFSALDYSNADRISYYYMIEGLNKDWMSTLLGVNVISYNNLSPGTYRLLVKACDNNIFSATEAYTITIRPPWYQTWWAYTLITLLCLLAIYGVITYFLSRFRYKQEILKKEHNEAISEAKLQFFINVSHEIRTPMTLIINPLERLMAENSDSAIQKTYLMIYRNSQRILRLINQLMDIRKLDKGQMRIRCRETDIVGFIEDLRLTFEYQANKKNIDFSFIHKDENLKVWIDLNNFDKVLLNILSNAFKYTQDNGGIEIKLEKGINEDEQYCFREYFQITVSDTGIGIDDSKIEDIFKRFYQIETSEVNQYYGTGIGLHLSRLLVELHHGIIFAENRKDRQGSRFIVRLPLGNAHLANAELVEDDTYRGSAEQRHFVYQDMSTTNSEQASKGESRTKTKYKILIVEDDEEIRNYLKDELSKDYRVKESPNGKEGYEAILREPPDLVISDVMMPEMDGITLCRKLKQNINVNHIPIILLTAKARVEDKLEGLDIGADAYLSKPFNSDELKHRIDNLIDNRARLKAKYTGSQEQDDKVNKIELKSTDEVLLNRIMRVINENISNPDLNVEMLAQNVGMSRVHMHRKLKELTNQSARDFIKGIRLKQAAELLSSKKLPISDVAYAIGFSNLSHFSNSFREFHGMSPKEYMNTKQAKEEDEREDTNS